MTSHGTPAVRRRTAVLGAAAGLVLLAGLFLVLAPWIAGFGGAGVLALSDTVLGLVLVALAIARTATRRLALIGWVIPVLGAWVVLSPWLLSQAGDTPPSAAAITGNVVAGAVVVVAGVCSALAGER
ncbi:SPW repeat domain-containing protein [Amycolatopsis tolypomycina]|uniref:SPW repeat-containing protein n=1 Tax=Amycolatopsis tolypomycina TaxID=208445 RepID=A0A1H4UGP5_9PSEU|nr:SPW repeat protein [Amycolatopsis tolypomycina]SEC68032.1 SPW repeat-containing protein [Amycolatopsis tolypomycina]